ncbi:MAG: winged helix-turn-helix transcriptional regulator [Pseudomonadota bacterium]|nr:winged helix-turn-helix transcriptional regulator [Pseudomonadota bacterium]
MNSSKTSNEASNNESQITLGLLNAVHENSSITQRLVARDLGIALGLANAYLKRCIRKGYIKVKQIPSNRYAYYLTPQGFTEKTRLTANYLTYSFTFFRRARKQCLAALQECEHRNWKRVVLAGTSELSEILTLTAGDTNITIAGIVDKGFKHKKFAGLEVFSCLNEIGQIDAVVITDVNNPQDCFDRLLNQWPRDRVIAPPILGIVDKKNISPDDPTGISV